MNEINGIEIDIDVMSASKSGNKMQNNTLP